jgi:ParB family chromosome partitioning protein
MREKLGQWLGRNQLKVISAPLDKIRPNPFQPRRSFSETELTELAQSIQMYGVLQPVILSRPDETGSYLLVAGERRCRACRMIGLTSVPAVVQEMDEEKTASVALIENLQRRDLNYLEEAIAYHALLEQFSITQEELAFRIGKSQSAVANKLRLLRMTDAVWDKISPDRISERHARALLKLSREEDQLHALRQIYEKELNVRQTEELVEDIRHNTLTDPARLQRGRQISVMIKDARIFLNTIRETVARAKQTGLDMAIAETEAEDFLEIRISMPKTKRQTALTTRP